MVRCLTGFNAIVRVTVVLCCLGVTTVDAGNDAVQVQPAQPAGPEGPEEIVAVVGDDVISVAEFEATLRSELMRRYFHRAVPAEERPAVRREVLQGMIDRLLLLQEARRRGLIVSDDDYATRLEQYRLREQTRYRSRHGLSPDNVNNPNYDNNKGWKKYWAQQQVLISKQLREQAQLEQLKTSIHQQVSISKDSVREYYQQYPEKFTTPAATRVSLILLKVAPSAPAASWQDAHAKATKLVAALRNGAEFAGLARQHSDHESARSGGDLGVIHQGMLSPEVEQVLDKMDAGQVSDPVTLLQGIAVFRLDSRIDGRLNSFEQVMDRARALLTREKEEAAWQALQEKLQEQLSRGNPSVKIDEALLGSME